MWYVTICLYIYTYMIYVPIIHGGPNNQCTTCPCGWFESHPYENGDLEEVVCD